MKRQLVGGTHDGETVDNGDCPFVRMIEKVERPVFRYTPYKPGEPILPETIKTEDYTLRSFAFPHHGLWCKTYCYVLAGISDDEAARILNRRDSQQDW